MVTGDPRPVVGNTTLRMSNPDHAGARDRPGDARGEGDRPAGERLLAMIAHPRVSLRDGPGRCVALIAVSIASGGDPGSRRPRLRWGVAGGVVGLRRRERDLSGTAHGYHVSTVRRVTQRFPLR